MWQADSGESSISKTVSRAGTKKKVWSLTYHTEVLAYLGTISKPTPVS